MKYGNLTRISVLITISQALAGCLAGENQQFFDNTSTAGNLLGGGSGLLSVANSTPTPAPGATPIPTSTPIVGATPIPTSTPIVGATPIPTSTPIVVATPTPSSNPCTTAATTTQNLRIMFMVDNSGSTATTDPAHTYRVKTVQDFIAAYGSHTNLTYSFGYFSGTTAKEWDGSNSSFQSTATTPFGNSAVLSSALTQYEGFAPGGSTPYSAAFASLNHLVQQDEAAGTHENYVVVFMSDGQPTDISGNIVTGINTMVDSLRTAVQANGSLLTVSAVYFGPETDQTAINNLGAMSTEGQGQFVDTNLLTSSLQINDVITVPGTCTSP